MKTLYAVKTAAGYEGWSRRKGCGLQEAELHPTHWMAKRTADAVEGEVVTVEVTITLKSPK